VPLRVMMMTEDQLIVPEDPDAQDIFLLLPPTEVKPQLEFLHHCEYKSVVRGYLWKRTTEVVGKNQVG
jgi:hypothetical protein